MWAVENSPCRPVARAPHLPAGTSRCVSRIESSLRQTKQHGEKLPSISRRVDMLTAVRPVPQKNVKLQPRRHPLCSRTRASSEGLDEPSLTDSNLQMMELPCLPFNPVEVLVPASTKTLHLYEARYLALLEEALNKTQGLFAHIILEPMRSKGAEMSFVASNCCLCFVESVRRLEIGALVTVRGISRLRLLTLTQMEPYLKGSVVLQPDKVQGDADREEELKTRVEELKDTLRDVQRLQIRLKAPGDSPLQTPLEEAVQWVEKAVSGRVPSLSALSTPQQQPSPPPSPSPSVDSSPAGPSSPSLSSPSTSFKDPSSPPIVTLPPWPSQTSPIEKLLPSRSELMAFAALQPVTASSRAELHKLLQKRLLAMETLDTFRRVDVCKEYAEEVRASLAAKLALQSISL